MYFKRLEINGFKSFADRTVLNFEPGITAIVGPNGCGKSNIFDSIRWVLGEQSVKALRGTEMSDVIFNGTDKREALNYAEVSFTLSNETKILPIEYEEVEVTRRIYRSGESEYFINKTQVRLKDIQALLAGTGIGSEAYSLVEQGKIDLILSSKPEDRRLVFDEASGITRYKSQKREAIRKLKDTEDNLLRLNDIIIEVKRQIGSLERQANKARRYQQMFNELKVKETDLAAIKLNIFKTKNNGLEGEIAQAQSSIDNVDSQEGILKNNLTEKQKQLASIEESIDEIRSKIQEIDGSITLNKQQITMNEERKLEVNKRLNVIALQKEQLKETRSPEEEKLNSLKRDLDQINVFVAEKENLLKIKEEQQVEIDKIIHSARTKISQSKARVMEMAVSNANINNSLNDLSSQIQTALARKKRLEIEKLKSEEERKAIQFQFDELDREFNSIKEKFDLEQGELNTLKNTINDKHNSLNMLKEKLQDLEKQLSSLKTQRDFLNELKLKYDEIPQAFKAVVLLEDRPSENITGILAKIENISENPDSGNEFKFKAFAQAKPIPMDTRDIDLKIVSTEEEIALITSEITNFEEELKNLNARMQEKIDSIHNYEIELNKKNTLRNEVKSNLEKIVQEVELVVIELEDTNKLNQELNQKYNSLKEELASLQMQIDDNNHIVESSQKQIEDSTKILQENEVLIAECKTELQGVDKRVESLKESIVIVQRSLTQNEQSSNNLTDEESALDKRIIDIDEGNVKIENSIVDAKKESDELGLSLSDDRKLQEEVNQLLKSCYEEISAFQNEIEDHRNNLHELRLNEQKIGYEKDSLRQTMLQSYQINIDDIDMNKDLPEESALLIEIEPIKNRLGNYGNVNLVAIDEYDELKKRYDFLIQQQEDLNQAKDSLREAITKINRTTRKMFIETFERIREEFKKHFKLLFGGGSADLYLSDPDNVLESGIEIVCRPPGKKLQNVLLLSGGEKSMAAIALLFSLFKVKPSPFCILDEIDAALDESNVGRYGQMVKDFSHQSQFIIITHNKKTIVNANVMYGITMQNSGISNIVSVKLSDHDNESKTGVIAQAV
ncbi:MAG: AAA family ATPase [Candidatus Gygaella obscura]|nr:AAA family ATPase [Candidatus Gygaella obscura]